MDEMRECARESVSSEMRIENERSSNESREGAAFPNARSSGYEVYKKVITKAGLQPQNTMGRMRVTENDKGFDQKSIDTGGETPCQGTLSRSGLTKLRVCDDGDDAFIEWMKTNAGVQSQDTLGLTKAKKNGSRAPIEASGEVRYQGVHTRVEPTRSSASEGSGDDGEYTREEGFPDRSRGNTPVDLKLEANGRAAFSVRRSQEKPNRSVCLGPTGLWRDKRGDQRDELRKKRP